MEILLPLTGKHAAVNQRLNVNFKVRGSVIVCISDCFYRLERGLKELGAVRASTRMRNIAHLQRRAAEHFQVDRLACTQTTVGIKTQSLKTG